MIRKTKNTLKKQKTGETGEGNEIRVTQTTKRKKIARLSNTLEVTETEKGNRSSLKGKSEIRRKRKREEDRKTEG